MPQRVSDQQAEMATASTDQRTRDLALDLLDARQQLADANAAIKKLQRELNRKERDAR